MKLSCGWRASLASASLAFCALASTPTQAQSWRAATVASFDEVWQTINDSYYDPAFGGLDWAGIRTELRPRVEGAPDEDAARRVVREMLARLRQSHFVLLSSSSPTDTLPGTATVPIDIRADTRGLVVVRAERGSSTASAGVRAGDRITTIDGMDTGAWFQSADGSDQRARFLGVWQRAYRALHGAPGSRARLTVIGPAGDARVVEVSRQAESGRPVMLGNLPPLYARTRVADATTPAGRRVGVVAFNIWMTAITEPVAAAVDKYRRADGLVIDLRGNPGGLAEMMRGIAGHVLSTPELLGRVHMRGVELEFRANPRRSTSDGRTVAPFAGPLAILVDELTASTSECFTGALQSLGRARVFGAQTRGEALPAATRRLSNGDVLLYAIGDFLTSTGQRLEGAGVAPDEVVRVSLEALAAGRDPVLEAALAWVDARR